MSVLHHPPSRLSSTRAFTLVELLVSTAVISMILLLLANMTSLVANSWSQGERRVQTIQSARGALELITREMTPAIVDTRMQYVILPGSELESAGAEKIAPKSPAALWMAPLGQQGDMCCVGIYLIRDETNQSYHLKRLYIPSNHPKGYFPQIANLGEVRSPNMRTNPANAEWFTHPWDHQAFDESNPNNTDVVVSTLADNVIALWLQPIDHLGNGIPWVSRSHHHPESNLIYNSAAYFVAATNAPFSDGSSIRYMAATNRTMRANRLPAALDITLISIDRETLDRGLSIPEQQNIFTNDALDLAASVKAYQRQLAINGIHTARTYNTRVKLLNGN